ncbi:MAG: SpoIIE family protein phosphatase [Bacteroidales bacterium]|nr:SpoIIE family protein phosphatase [Bacteroidales bacterium]
MYPFRKDIARTREKSDGFLDKELHVELVINQFRMLILFLLALLDLLSGYFEQISLISSLSDYRASVAFLILLPFMIALHVLTTKGKYRFWIKYITQAVDLMLVFLIALPVVVSNNPNILLTKLEFTLIISFLIIFLNTLSILRISPRSIIYTGLIALTLNATLYILQDQFIMIGIYTSVFIIILSIFNGWVTNFILDYFTTNHKLSEAYDDLKNAHEQIQQKNAEITRKSNQIETQVNSLEDVHKDLMDSLMYAQKIQVALINHEEVVAPHVHDHFVMFKPREHVSGDFYWASWTGSKLIMTVADCTGHGVPGAFMTMLGSSYLNEIVNKEGITEPDQVLNHLRDSIIDALHQKGKIYETRDGMDMAVVQIDTLRGILKFSGANNSLCYIPNHHHEQEPRIYEFKGDRMPISFHYKMHPFSILETTYSKGDRFYLYTDGYIDQFGGPKGKKFKLVPFKRMLLEHHNKTMSEQRNILEKTMQDWLRDKYQQIDDITVLGFQV